MQRGSSVPSSPFIAQGASDCVAPVGSIDSGRARAPQRSPGVDRQRHCSQTIACGGSWRSRWLSGDRSVAVELLQHASRDASRGFASLVTRFCVPDRERSVLHMQLHACSGASKGEAVFGKRVPVGARRAPIEHLLGAQDANECAAKASSESGPAQLGCRSGGDYNLQRGAGFVGANVIGLLNNHERQPARPTIRPMTTSIRSMSITSTIRDESFSAAGIRRRGRSTRAYAWTPTTISRAG